MSLPTASSSARQSSEPRCGQELWKAETAPSVLRARKTGEAPRLTRRIFPGAKSSSRPAMIHCFEKTVAISRANQSASR